MMPRIGIALALALALAIARPAAAPLAIRMAAPTALPAAVRARLHGSRLVDLPQSRRSVNWSVGSFDNGSCMWASLMNLLRWQGRDELADWISHHRGGGANANDLIAVLDQAGSDWAFGRDVAFLEWCCRTRRGAIVQWGPGHVVNLVGLNERTAWLMDNTGPLGQQLVPYRRADFLAYWSAHGGWGMTPLAGVPTPPKPWLFWEDES